MQVTDATIKNLAHLARLRFSEEETVSVKNDLQNMIAFVEQLKEIDTTGVEPILHMSDTVNVLRDDVVKGSVSREDALLNAPLKDESFFKVPTVIKK
jgi:aspartyl-tRNA(Asn)/glutamyl-tRNA(Gln) amidotransferase subunit C